MITLSMLAKLHMRGVQGRYGSSTVVYSIPIGFLTGKTVVETAKVGKWLALGLPNFGY